jgi:hypothetical protein
MSGQMTPKDFYNRFVKLLQNIKETNELETNHDALVLWYGENCLLLDPEDVKERIVHDSHAEGVDAILVDKPKYGLIFVQGRVTDTFENTEKNFPETEVKSTLHGISFLIKGDYKGKITPELENLVNEYHDLDITGDYETKVVFLALKKPPLDDKFIVNFQREFPSVKVEFWDFGKLLSSYSNDYLLRRAPPPEKYSFKVLAALLNKDDPIKARVFTSSGEELARFYETYKERIFQQDVRLFLGKRSRSINAQILATAMSDAQSRNFWYFNNGVTLVCKRIVEATSGTVVNLESPQIINGAQTTYALYDAHKNGQLKDNVQVLLRVIETDDRPLIEKVTLYTNSQNAIKLRDLCSNDPIQIEIQNMLLGTYRYFYERKRGEFQSSYPTPEAQKNLLGSGWSAKLISNENAAQAYLAMFLGKPSEAKAEKARIFIKDGGFYDDIFCTKDSSTTAEKLLLAWRLLKYVEAHKSRYRRQYKKAEKLPRKKRNEIYRFDFVLHSEYFFLNLMRDFLRHQGYDDDEMADRKKVIEEIDSGSQQIQTIYSTIERALAAYIARMRLKRGYYHNKFFKSEKSIGLIRDYFNTRFRFVDVVS